MSLHRIWTVVAWQLLPKKGRKTRKIILNLVEGSLLLGSLEELNRAERKLPNTSYKGVNLIPDDILWLDSSIIPDIFLNEGNGCFVGSGL